MEACLIIASLLRNRFHPINALIEENLCPRLVALLANPDSEVVGSVLKVVENFFENGTDNQIQVLHSNQVLQNLINILNNHDSGPSLLRSVCGTIAYIVINRSSQIQVDDIKYEAVYAISSAVERGSHEQIRYLVDRGSIAALSGGLLSQDNTRRTSCFQGLLKILRMGEANKVDGVNPYIQMVTNMGGLALIKNLIDDPQVGDTARRMLNSFWPREL